MSMPRDFTRLGDRLRRYTPALASISRTMFDARNGFASKYQIASASSVKDPPLHRTACVRIGSGHGELSVRVRVSDYAALELIALEPDHAQRVALANLWLASSTEMLSRHGIIDAEVLDVSLDTEIIDTSMRQQSKDSDQALHLAYHDANAIHTASLLDASTDIAAALARHAAATRDASSMLADSITTISVPTRIRLRSRRCTSSVLASLRRGDVLLGWPHARGYASGNALGHVTAYWGAASGLAACAQGSIDGCNIILETPPKMMSYDTDLSLKSASNASDENTAPDNPIDMNQVELPVHIEVATVNLTIGQIAALQPGYILNLPLTLNDSEIRLIAHGQTLATGELVVVGDNLGLFIQHIANPDERNA
ncbi:type III secretion protein Q [Robbsia andropogonis]|uniref:type III secretion system cytoplasmic ring protein SctQ n=1 Tax=Robbsia andropogonis TaxID=28092 RepID=UPI003D1C20D3